MNCSFCGKSHEDAGISAIIRGENVNICDLCVQECNNILAERKEASADEIECPEA